MTAATVEEPPPAAGPTGHVDRLVALARNPRVVALVDQAVVSGTNFVTGWALMRLVGETGMGVYTLAMTLVIVGVGMQTELVTNPFKVYGQSKRGNTLRRYAGSAVIHQAVCSGLLLLLLVGAAGAAGQLDKLSSILPALLVFGPMVMAREFVRQMSFAAFRFDEALRSDAIVSSWQILSIALLWAAGRLSAPAVLATYGAGCGLSVYVWYVRSRDRFRYDRRMVLRHLSRNWRFARWTLATFLVGSTTPFVMPWVLAAYHGEDATGLLAACNALIGLSYMFTTGIANWLTAGSARAYVQGGRAELMRVVWQTTGLMMLGLLPFVGLVWCCGEEILTFVYGDRVEGLGRVSFVIACGMLAVATNIVTGNALWAIDRPQDGLKADVSVFAATVALAVWLVPGHSVMGAAVATALGVTLGAVVRTLSLIAALRRAER